MQEYNSNKNLFKRLLIRFITTLSLLLITIYILPKLVQLLYPFILAFIFAVIFNPMVSTVNNWLHKLEITSKFSRNFITFILTIIIINIISFGSYFLFSVLIKEIIELATSIQTNWPSIVLVFENTQKWLISQIDIMPGQTIELLNNLTVTILEFIRNISKNLLNLTVATTSTIISGTGTFFFKFVTFFLAFYFIIVDYNRIKGFVKRHIDKRVLNTVMILKESTLVALGGYLKTQIIFALIAFIFMFTAFIIYEQEYALILALILGVVDLLPLVGTSAVLLPWAAFEFLVGNSNKAFFLLIIGIGFFVFRRLAEPKIMGNQTGLHPLFALISIYIGIQFSGLWGAFIGPLIMIVIISVINSGLLDNTIADLKELYYKIIILLQR